LPKFIITAALRIGLHVPSFRSAASSRLKESTAGTAKLVERKHKNEACWGGGVCEHFFAGLF